MENSKKIIKTFQDLIVYQNIYGAMKVVLIEIVPKLPKEEKYDLADQMRRCCKASPALLAEGFAKRYQKKNWEKYLNDSIGECNEMIHHLSVCIDIYPRFVDTKICESLTDTYNIACKQITSLRNSWQNFHEEKHLS